MKKNTLFAVFLLTCVHFVTNCKKPETDAAGKIQLVANQVSLGSSSAKFPSAPWGEVCEPTQGFCWKSPSNFVSTTPGDATIVRMLPFPNQVMWLVEKTGNVMRFDGKAWTRIQVPVENPALFDLKSAHGVSANEIWVTTQREIFQCTPASCVAKISPIRSIDNIWGSNIKDDIWIYGSKEIAHFNGIEFVLLPGLDLLLGSIEPYFIKGVGRDDMNNVRIVAASLNSLTSNLGVIKTISWDGTQVKASSIADLPEGTFDNISFLGAASAADWWLVGSLNNRLQMYRLASNQWTKSSAVPGNCLSMNVRTYNNTLWGVGPTAEGKNILADLRSSGWAFNENVAPAGEYDFWVSPTNELYWLENKRVDSLRLSKTGPNVSAPLAPVWEQRSFKDLDKVCGSDPEEAWITFQNKNTLAHITGQTMTEYTLPTPITAMWSGAKESVWFGTQDGMYRFDGAKFFLYTWPKNGMDASFVIKSISGSDPNDVWMVSDLSVFHYDGNVVSLVATIALDTKEAALNVVQGIRANDVWFGGRNVLIHYDGDAFVYKQTKQNILSFYSTAANKVWLTNDAKELILFDGDSFLKQSNSPGGDVLWGKDLSMWQYSNNALHRGDGLSWQKWLDLSSLAATGEGEWKLSVTDKGNMWLYSRKFGYLLRRK